MTQKYRIIIWRLDERVNVYSEPEFDGETLDACDEQAVKHFQAISDLPAHEWDGMAVVRIDAPAVAEKITHLKSNGRQEPKDD